MRGFFKKSLPLLLLVGLFTDLNALNGFKQIGYGAKAQGMGGVAIALPQDAFAAANNPAGMVLLCNRLDGGVHGIHQSATLKQFYDDGFLNRKSTSDHIIVYPEVARNWHICPNQTIGLTIYSFGGTQVEYNDATLFGPLANPGLEYKQFIIAPSWSWRINCMHSVGVAVNIAFNWLSVEGLEGEVKDRSESPAYVTGRGTDHEEGISIRLGWLGNLGCGVKVGLTYQTPTWINHFRKYKGFFPDRGDWILPSIWGAGISGCYRNLTAGFDIELIQWSVSRFMRNDKFNVGPFGSPDGPGVGWRDQLVYKVGVAWQALPCLIVRLGYNYGKTPYQGVDLVLNALLACQTEHHLTTGGTISWGANEITLDCVRGFSHTLSTPGLQLQGFQDSIGIAYARKF